MTFDWSPITEGLIPPYLPEGMEIGSLRRLVRNIVIAWLSEKFFPTMPTLTVFDKCIMLFDRKYLREISEDYYRKLLSGERHWIEYVYSILEDIRMNFTKEEVSEYLSGYGIGPVNFVEMLTCVSGFVQHISRTFESGNTIDNISEYLDTELDKLGGFYGIPYASETNFTMNRIGHDIGKLCEKEIKEKVVEMLNSREIPTLYEDDVVFDMCNGGKDMSFGLGMKKNREKTSF